jgi:hypothetical protein
LNNSAAAAALFEAQRQKTNAVLVAVVAKFSEAHLPMATTPSATRRPAT